MNPTFQSLIHLLPPPQTPVENQGDWTNVEQQLGTPLPADYKWFISTYGTGSICAAFINVLNPFAANRYLNLLEGGKSTLEWFRNDQTKGGIQLNPHPVFPEPGGILPWGTSANGHDMFWLTQGEPDDWSTVFHDRDRVEVRTYEKTCITEFLVTLLSGQMDGGKFTILGSPDIKPEFRAVNYPPIKKVRKTREIKSQEMQQRTE